MSLSKQPNNGFIIVASKHTKYLQSALMCYDSLLDHYPDANITLFVSEELYNKTSSLLTRYNVVYSGVPEDKRAKLWALYNTPYENTVYLDSDTFVVNDEIQTIWNQQKDNDILITKIRRYNSNPKGYMENKEFPYIHHGGVFIYSKKAIPFMKEWWTRWKETRALEIFKETYPDIPPKMKEWDQFYLWYLIYKTDHGLKIDFFEDDARWNFVTGYFKNELNGKPPIIEHYTIKGL